MEEKRKLKMLRQHILCDKLLAIDSIPFAGNSAAQQAAIKSQPERLANSKNLSHFFKQNKQPSGSDLKSTSINTNPNYISTSSPTSTSPPASSVSVKPVRTKPLKRQEKEKLLEALDKEEVSVCTKCELHQSRTQTVFGAGDVDAKLMFVGEGPGKNEDEQGAPFVGRSGELLTKMIKAIGFERQQVYIANVVKCRPPENRTPTAKEAAVCGKYLQRQIAIIQPKVIVTLGGPAAKLLLNPKLGITRIRGTWHEYIEVEPAIPVMPTFHPAYILRNYTPEFRAKAWSDLKAAATRALS